MLRPITEADASEIYEYSHNPNVGIHAGWKAHESIEETKEIMNQLFIGQDHIFGIVLKENNKLIGTVGLLKDPHRSNPRVMMLGYAMSEEQWGKGLMTEAARAIVDYSFREVPIDLLTCTCYPTNHRSYRVIEKCGFRHEGCLRQCEMRFDGAIMDMECFSISREEYEKSV